MDFAKKNLCIRCGCTWKPHRGKEASKVCPKCKSPYWNTPKQEQVYYDPDIHDKIRNDFNYLIETVYCKMPTLLACHLHIEYPALMRLIKANKDWKPFPEHIVSRIEELLSKARSSESGGIK